MINLQKIIIYAACFSTYGLNNICDAQLSENKSLKEKTTVNKKFIFPDEIKTNEKTELENKNQSQTLFKKSPGKYKIKIETDSSFVDD